MNLSNLNNFRTEQNLVELIWFWLWLDFDNRTRTFTNFLIIFDFFCKKFGSVQSNWIDQMYIIQYLHHLNASYSVYFELNMLLNFKMNWIWCGSPHTWELKKNWVSGLGLSLKPKTHTHKPIKSGFKTRVWLNKLNFL